MSKQTDKQPNHEPMTDKQTEPTILIREIMEQTGVRDRSSVMKRIRKGDFDTNRNGLVIFNDLAKRTIVLMKYGKAKNAGRKKKISK